MYMLLYQYVVQMLIFLSVSSSPGIVSCTDMAYTSLFVTVPVCVLSKCVYSASVCTVPVCVLSKCVYCTSVCTQHSQL